MSFDAAAAWLHAARVGDEDALLALAPGSDPGHWIALAQAAESAELTAGGVTLHGPDITLTFTGDGVTEAPIDNGPDPFVLNVADAAWLTGPFGAWTGFASRPGFAQVGFNVAALEPGQPLCYYHREADQEGFLILRGEALLLVDGDERPLRAWDFFHCPPGTDHVIVGAGEDGCTLAAFGARGRRTFVVYPASDLAQRHGAGVQTETDSPKQAYAAVEPDHPVEFDPRWFT